ncbi:glyoxalase-like domain-containing protein [Mycena floridula]|nr:glyoxalase-like domain-containing protein [Mycena floridula]
MQDIDTSCLDHVVHLSAPGTLQKTSQHFRDLGFLVVTGGVHADGLTENSLIILPDYAYIELLAFTKPADSYPPDSPRHTHRWAKKQPGWIDYAFLGNGSLENRVSDAINQRASADGSGTRYQSEQPGGRTKPDGKILKWLISAPESAPTGILPFFCGDVHGRSGREDRVGTIQPHPSLAQGISHVRILVSPNDIEAFSRQVTCVVGSQAKHDVSWNLHTVRGSASSLLDFGVPKDEKERKFLETHRPGIYEIGFYVPPGHGKETTETTFGRVAWKELPS